MAKAMIIESLGTTGSGKTSLIPILVDSLHAESRLAMSMTEAILFYTRNTGIGRLICSLFPTSLQNRILWRVFSYSYSNWYLFKFCINHSRLMIFVVNHQLRRKIPWSHRIMLLRLFLVMSGRYYFFRHYAKPGHMIFLDEGFVHRATHFLVSEAEKVDPEQVTAYLQLLPAPDLLMWVRSPIDLCLARVYSRGVQERSRLAHLSEREVQSFVSHSDQICQIAAEYAKNIGWSIIEVDNSNGLEACAVKLHNDVMAYLR